MLKLILCDDDSRHLAAIEKALGECTYSDGAQITAFGSDKEVLDYIAAGNQVDVAIIDIYMPEKDGKMYPLGIHLAEDLREAGFSGFIVFLTSSNSFAAQSYAVDAFYYLIKPVEKRDLQKMIDKLEETRKKIDTSSFVLKRKVGTRSIKYSDLMYVEVADHNLFFHMSDGEVLTVYASMHKYAETLLADKRMFKPHRSFIVNKDFVIGCEKGTAILQDNTQISIPKGFEVFQKEILEWMYRKKEN